MLQQRPAPSADRLEPLDGLRGLAVLAVLACHTFPLAEGGFLGVDVFFVLSGYLITSLLLKEWSRNGRISFRAFYLRRVARLAPAYVLMLAITVPLMSGPLLSGSQANPDRWPAALAAGFSVIYAANWADAFHAAGMGPLEHTWSLSVEEQFYVIWPAVLVLLNRRHRSLTRWLAVAIGLMTVGRVVWWATTHSLWPFFATVTRGDGLLIGCLLAVLLRRGHLLPRTTARAAAWSQGCAWAAGAVLVTLMLTSTIYSDSTYFFGLTATAAATAVIVRHVVTRPGGALAGLLSWRPLAAVGRVSYGLYLFHLPLFMLVWTFGLPLVPALALQYGLLGAVTVASWFLLERPVQRWARPRLTVPTVPVPAPSVPVH